MKNKTLFIFIGVVAVTAAAVACLLIFTDVFGMLGKNGDIISVNLNIDGVKQKITSYKLNSDKAATLKVGDICHFFDSEKQSIPYRWEYNISDENVVGIFHTEYKGASGFNTKSGGDSGRRWIYFKCLAPGECVITLRYGRIGEPDNYSEEYTYTVIVP